MENQHPLPNSNRAKEQGPKDKTSNLDYHKTNRKVEEIAAILENKMQRHKGQVTFKSNNKDPTVVMALPTKRNIEIRTRTKINLSELHELSF